MSGTDENRGRVVGIVVGKEWGRSQETAVYRLTLTETGVAGNGRGTFPHRGVREVRCTALW